MYQVILYEIIYFLTKNIFFNYQIFSILKDTLINHKGFSVQDIDQDQFSFYLRKMVHIHAIRITLDN